MKDRGRLLAFILLSALMLTASPARAELPVDEMRRDIERGVAYLMAAQQEDGCWPLRGGRYDVGLTSLATLALCHARSPKASVAVHKGMSWLTQRPPEQATYTAGLIEMLLFEDGASGHIRLINAYAWMTVMSQWRDPGPQQGSWGYDLVRPPPDMTGVQEKPGGTGGVRPPPVPQSRPGRTDHSNMQYAVLALAYAERAGYQVPTTTWSRVKTHYVTSQNQDGGWGYFAGGSRDRSTFSMTAASTVSLYLADEALTSKSHNQCGMVPEDRSVEQGMLWIGGHREQGAPYAWYAVERLGILTGRSEFGGRDWLEAGARALLREGGRGTWSDRGSDVAGTAFAVLFLARALEPVIVNKLKRRGDWDDDAYDVKHLTEYISVKFQYPKQWRIVTLDASVDDLLRVPVLYLNGHDPLLFTGAEKAKLKAYVDRGGTIFAMACCSKKPFDQSLRSLAAELWPDAKLTPLPKDHAIYKTPRPLASPPALEALALPNGHGRLGLIYSPHDLCCRWHQGGTRAKPVYDVGVNVYFYVSIVSAKLGGVREGRRIDTTGDAQSPENLNPEPPRLEPPKLEPPRLEPPKPEPPKLEPPEPEPSKPKPPKPEPPKPEPAEPERANPETGPASQMRRCFETLRKNNETYALFGAAKFYGKAHERDEALNVARGAMEGARAALRRPPSRNADAEMDRIVLVSGAEIIGHIRARSPAMIVIEVMGEKEPELKQVRTDDVKTAGVIMTTAEKASETTRARYCSDFVSAVESARHVRALAAWGKLCAEFPDIDWTSVLNDRLKAEFWRRAPTVDAVLEKATTWVALACPDCLGQKKQRCGECRGSGRIRVEEVCPRCGGAEPRRCARCGGKGTMTCPVCRGSGGFVTITWNNAPVAGELCWKCGGNGIIDCPDCRKGWVICSRCGGRGKIAVDKPCAGCEGRGSVPCATCAGTGLRGR